MRVGEKQKTLLRWEAIVAAFLMLLSMMLVVMPKLEVYAEISDDKIMIETNPDKIESGSNFSVTISFEPECNATIENNGGKVNVYSIGDISGSVSNGQVESAINKDGKLYYKLYIPSGVFSYNGVGDEAS
ncbi:MAG: hypothetical protein SOV73_06045, partial [Candidatus Faecivivens sp.]|nr:hypothetical protein [Candidatus Faecivivens sp.]